MKSKRKGIVVFKPYDPSQQMLLPPSLNEMVPEGHPVRLVNEVIDKIDLTTLTDQYKGGGTSSYHPKLLLKILVYGYLSNIYSSRKLEAAVRESVYLMWLSGMTYPDHHTINRFRSERLKDVLKEVFSQVVMLLVESEHVDLKEVYTDGTKIEANANRYTFVWGKSIKNNKARIAKQLEELWNYTQQVAKAELEEPMPDLSTIDSKKVIETIEKINTALKDKQVDKKKAQKLNYAKKEWPALLDQYERQEAILKSRGSYSKTDLDATFMRMKDDPMAKGQLKAAYNLQISTHKQFITYYSIHQNPTDTVTLIPHLEAFKKQYNRLPENITADAGYGSQENYTWLEENKIEAFVKYSSFQQEQRPNKIDEPGKIDNLFYNKEQDCFYCPMGQPMKRIDSYITTTDNGFEQEYVSYQAKNCENCPLRGVCFKGEGNRIINVNYELQRLKAKARELLLSQEGIRHRKQRPVDVEPVFGNIKQNKNFKRFLLRSTGKVETEIGLIALAHNLAKKAA
jgi:transposase